MRRKILEYVGDADPISYGGGVIVQTPYGPILEHTVQALSDYEVAGVELFVDEDTTTLQIVIIPLSDSAEDFWDTHDWVDWTEISKFSGIAREDITADTLLDQYWTISLVKSYYGWVNFDSSPLTITIKDLRKRWELD